MAFNLTSSAFTDGGKIPSQYTCKGENISPPLNWSDLPANTQSLVLIVDDPDAPDPRAPKMTWVHWVLYNIPVDIDELPAGASPAALPAGSIEGINDWKKTGYGGPCPPIGEHRYFHKLYALDSALEVISSPTKANVLAAMQGHIIGETELIGTYEKSR
jgi:hypothetical protein